MNYCRGDSAENRSNVDSHNLWSKEVKLPNGEAARDK